jgi:hypothetical protein
VRFTLVGLSAGCPWRCCRRVQFSASFSASSARIGLEIRAFASHMREERGADEKDGLPVLEGTLGGPQPSGGRRGGAAVPQQQPTEDAWCCGQAHGTESAPGGPGPGASKYLTLDYIGECGRRLAGRSSRCVNQIVRFTDQWPQDISSICIGRNTRHGKKTRTSLDREFQDLSMCHGGMAMVPL